MIMEAKLYIKASVGLKINDLLYFSSFPLYIVFGSVSELEELVLINKDKIVDYHFEISSKSEKIFARKIVNACGFGFNSISSLLKTDFASAAYGVKIPE